MKARLHSEHISKRLYIAMLIIIASLLALGIPQIITSHQNYIQSQKALITMTNLGHVANLTNKISKERAPANKVMSSSPDELAKHHLELQNYRKSVDAEITRTLHALRSHHFGAAANHLEQHLVPTLRQARQKVDAYAATPPAERDMYLMDDTIVSMFNAWGQSYHALQIIVKRSKERNEQLTHYHTSVLVLADLRDQAGRVASNIMAPITFNHPIPQENLGRTLQTQYQTRYLYDLVGAISVEYTKYPEFLRLYQDVEKEFIGKGIPIVQMLTSESLSGQPYTLTGTQLTEQIVDKFTTIVALQEYILEQGHLMAAKHKQKAQQLFIFTLFSSVAALLCAILTMIYAKRWVFNPLMQIRQSLFELAHQNTEDSFSKEEVKNTTLFEAMDNLKYRLNQRDQFELQLKRIANTDPLTNVGNRLALDDYLQYKRQIGQGFEDTSLFVIDIDTFKQINDQFGHTFGDHVIQQVAQIVQDNVRADDLVVRYGGDEFIVMIEGLSPELSFELAECIRSDVLTTAMYPTEYAPAIYVSLSIGIKIGAASWQNLFNAADAALFQAKSTGRNKSCIANSAFL